MNRVLMVIQDNIPEVTILCFKFYFSKWLMMFLFKWYCCRWLLWTFPTTS